MLKKELDYDTSGGQLTSGEQGGAQTSVCLGVLAIVFLVLLSWSFFFPGKGWLPESEPRKGSFRSLGGTIKRNVLVHLRSGK